MIFIHWIAFIPLEQKTNKLELHKIAVENKDFYNTTLLSKDTKILEFNNIKNLIKHYLLYADLEC